MFGHGRQPEGKQTKDGLLLVSDTSVLGVISGTDDDETLLKLEKLYQESKIRPTHLGEGNELVVVGHEDGDLLSESGEQSINVAVNLGDLDVGVAVL